MYRTFFDALETEWTVVVERPDDAAEVADEEVVLRFGPDDDSDEREIRARGPVEESFPTLDEEQLRLAVEAAGNELGFLYLRPDGELWWVRRGEDDPRAEGAMVTFTSTTDQVEYRGSLGADPETLSEDELRELLDEARELTSP